MGGFAEAEEEEEGWGEDGEDEQAPVVATASVTARAPPKAKRDTPANLPKLPAKNARGAAPAMGGFAEAEEEEEGWGEDDEEKAQAPSLTAIGGHTTSLAASGPIAESTNSLRRQSAAASYFAGRANAQIGDSRSPRVSSPAAAFFVNRRRASQASPMMSGPSQASPMVPGPSHASPMVSGPSHGESLGRSETWASNTPSGPAHANGADADTYAAAPAWLRPLLHCTLAVLDCAPEPPQSASRSQPMPYIATAGMSTPTRGHPTAPTTPNVTTSGVLFDSASSSTSSEAARLMRAAHRANENGDFEEAFHLFTQSDQLQPRPSARISAANMALKLGDAAGAMETYLALLRDGALPEDAKQRDMLLRKIREASNLTRQSPASGGRGPMFGL